MKKPRGKIPKEISEFLAANPDVPQFMCICECGRWFSRVDRLAPYHWEKSFCNKCGYLESAAKEEESEWVKFANSLPDEIYFGEVQPYDTIP